MAAMNIKLIVPFECFEASVSSAETFKIQQLNLPLLTALTPPGHRIKIVDECFAPDDVEEDVDLVGVTVMTELALRAYQIGDAYRERDVRVVMGGIHPTVLPDEALQHADAVVLGEGEDVWPQVVSDAAAGRLKEKYWASRQISMAGRPVPRYDLYPALSFKSYTPLVVGVETSRGCPYDCEFCSVGRVMGHKYRLRPAHEVVSELESIENPLVLFVDDNFALHPKVAKELLTALIPLQCRWVAQGTVSLAEDPGLLRLMKRSGCLGLLIGFESIHDRAQSRMSKLRKLKVDYAEAIRRFHGEGIMILGAFIFGFDDEDKDIFDRTLEFATSHRLDLVQFRYLAPYPGTRLYERLLKEGRLFVTDWWLKGLKGDALLFRPKGVTPEGFVEGLERIKREFHSAQGIITRFFGINPWKRSRLGLAMYVGANLGNRKRYRGSRSAPPRVGATTTGAHERKSS
jgi:radical SAM superfamily enzyme YgiQ (UPF0313 family)